MLLSLRSRLRRGGNDGGICWRWYDDFVSLANLEIFNVSIPTKIDR